MESKAVIKLHRHHFVVALDRGRKICWCGTTVKLRRTKRLGARR